MYTKNNVLTVTIEDIGNDGEGIGKVDGYTLFIKDAVIGDVVEVKIMKAKKNYAYAKLEKVIAPSSFRVTPICPIHKQCGGCQIQAMAYEEQLRFKQNKIFNNLVRIGKMDEAYLYSVMEPIVGMEEPFHYRNKAQFPVGTDKEGNLVTGFYAGRTHTIIPNLDCALGDKGNKEILQIVLNWMKEKGLSAYHEETGQGLVRHVLIRKGFVTGEWMVCLVVNADGVEHTDWLVKGLCKLNGMKSISYSVNKENTNVIMGKDIHVLWGQGYITDFIGNVKFQISPLSFYQVNPGQMEKLYGLVLEYAGLTGNEVVWDLYCGIGTISLFLAQAAKKVYGVEVMPKAIADAKRNAKINGIENAEFFVGKAEEVLPRMYEEEGIHTDIIVVDPPRKGCDEKLLETILLMKPERIVYVSCDSATLARDVKVLGDGGYEVKRVRGVDQFGQTVHVECVVLMSRVQK